MAVSWYVPTIRRFADPSKHGRLYHILEPFLAARFLGNLTSTTFAKMFKTTQEFAQDKRIISGIGRYKDYHRHLLEALPKLGGKKIVFLPGITIDQSEQNPAYICVDYASERNRLSEKILFGMMDLHRKRGVDMFDDVHYIAVSPLALPFHATSDGTLVHSLDEVVDETNGDIENGRFGNTVLDPLSEDFKPGIIQYSATIINSKLAKRAHGRTLLNQARKYKRTGYLEDRKLENLIRWFGSEENIRAATKEDVDRRIGKDIRFNRHLMAAAYAHMVEVLELDTLVCYMTRSSPEHKIMEIVAKMTGTTLDDWGKEGVMKNAGISTLKESDEAAIRRLKGRIYSWYVEKTGTDPPLVAPVSRVTETEPRYSLPQMCPKLKFYRCPFASEMPLPSKCACDVADGKFTIDDVRGMNDEKYGGKKLVSDIWTLKGFQELQKRITYRDETGEFRQNTGLEILRDDLRDQGWTITSVEVDLMLMQMLDANISRIGPAGDYVNRSWRRFMGDKRLIDRLKLDREPGRVEPLVVPPERPDQYSLRPSEFSGNCPIGRVLGKMDMGKLPEEIIPHKWALAGSMRHVFSGPWPYADYAGRRLVTVPKHLYTEVELWSSFPNRDREFGELDTINVYGRADGLFQLVDDRRRIPILYDGKRSPNEKPAYTVQLLLYHMGLARAMGQPFEQGVLMLVNRPHFAEFDERKFPIYHYTYADAQSLEEVPFSDFDISVGGFRTIEGLENLVVHNYRQQRAMLDSRQSFLGAMNMCANTTCAGSPDGQCGHPFNKQACDLVRNIVKNGVHPKSLIHSKIAL